MITPEMQNDLIKLLSRRSNKLIGTKEGTKIKLRFSGDAGHLVIMDMPRELTKNKINMIMQITNGIDYELVIMRGKEKLMMMIQQKEPISMYDEYRLNDLKQEMIASILRECHIVTHRNLPQKQLLAGGKILTLLEISDSLRLDVRQSLSNNKMCNKAFDMVVEMRHFDCDALKQVNKRLPVK